MNSVTRASTESRFRYYFPIIAIAAATLSAALMIVPMGAPLPFAKIGIYIVGELTAFLIVALSFVFWQIAHLARTLSDRPLATVWAQLRPKLSRWFLPVVVFPVFLGGYSSIKAAIPLLSSYRLDAALAGLDRGIFGTDPWRLAHSIVSPVGAQLIAGIYVPGWFAAVGFSTTAIAIFARRETTARFYLAMLGTWFVGGIIAAYAMASAGPIFVHLVDPVLGREFAPLQADLLAKLGHESSLVLAPQYLERGFRTGGFLPGGGISAMPSMHFATATIYVLTARGTRFFWPAILFAAVIAFSSVFSGYHYFIDDPAAAGIAAVCWYGASYFYSTAAPVAVLQPTPLPKAVLR